MNEINNINEKVTILIVTFKSHYIIEKCLDGADGVGTFALIPDFKEFKR